MEELQRSLETHLWNGITTIKNCDQMTISAKQFEIALISSYHEKCPLREKKGNRNTSWWIKKLNKLRKELDDFLI